MAAAEAAQAGRATLLVEKNSKAGVKILMSGAPALQHHASDRQPGHRGGLRVAGTLPALVLAALGVSQTIELFNAEGVATKVEPTGKVFPVSDRATDALAALVRRVRCTMAEPCAGRSGDRRRVRGPVFASTLRRTLIASKLLITTGGQSYPGCGTVGDGYRWASLSGHTIVTPRPRSCRSPARRPGSATWRASPSATWNLGVTEPADEGAQRGERPAAAKVLAERRGSLLFAHFGLSGPVVLDVSRAVSGHANPQSLVLECDFLPAIDRAVLIESWREQARSAGKRQLGSLVGERLARCLCDALMATANISPETKIAEVRARRWETIADALKRLTIPVQGTLGFKKAEVTAGGIALDEIDSRTMQSKLCRTCSWPAKCSTWTARSAATTSKPLGAPARSPVRSM